jgi:hypothetical protein
MEKVYSFFAEYSLRLSAGGPHFNLGKASDCLLNFFRTELLIDTKFIPSGSERLTGLVWRSIPLESSASVVSTQSSATENILRALNVMFTMHYP